MILTHCSSTDDPVRDGQPAVVREDEAHVGRRGVEAVPGGSPHDGEGRQRLPDRGAVNAAGGHGGDVGPEGQGQTTGGGGTNTLELS